ncbi:MAG: class I SAM-dependent methyltransferase [Thermoanaerobaculia bacterium]|nr:class I SAM-dependent methyltransferase [Thermoanaerobaculia bacterium]
MSAYAVTAQFYDAVAADQHAAVDAEIAGVLQGLDTIAGPVVDIGAGTGLSTQVIARALPEAEILAVEPDPAMRPALMTRLWSDPDLRQRVTILPSPLLSAPLPAVISGAVASASLVHFDPQDRRLLWELLSDRLSPCGRAIFEIQCPTAQNIPETCIGKIRVGRVTYECRASAERIDAARLRWHLQYISRLDGSELDHQSTEYVCWALSPEQALAEAGAFGLVGFETGSLVILGHPQ